MHRHGCDVGDALALARMVVDHPNLTLEGVSSHIATADAPDHPSTSAQIQAFTEVVTRLEAHGISPNQVHLANSATGLRGLVPPGVTTFIRAGIALYGIAGDADTDGWGDEVPCELRPVCSLKARISNVRGSPIARATFRSNHHHSALLTPPPTATVGMLAGARRTRKLRSTKASDIGRECGHFAPRLCRRGHTVAMGKGPRVDRWQAETLFRRGDDGRSADRLWRRRDSSGRGSGSHRHARGAHDPCQRLGAAQGDNWLCEVVCGISSRVPRVYLQRWGLQG